MIKIKGWQHLLLTFSHSKYPPFSSIHLFNFFFHPVRSPWDVTVTPSLHRYRRYIEPNISRSAADQRLWIFIFVQSANWIQTWATSRIRVCSPCFSYHLGVSHQSKTCTGAKCWQREILSTAWHIGFLEKIMHKLGYKQRKLNVLLVNIPSFGIGILRFSLPCAQHRD